MTIEELETTHRINLQIKFSPYSNKWYCTSDAEIMEDSFLISTVGDHCDSPEEALQSHIKKIRGKLVCTNPTSKDRREFVVPKTLTR